jgi:predicted DNA binding CopG/RHH family protein
MKKKKVVPGRRAKMTVKPSAEPSSVTPLQALRFLEDIRVLYASKDEPTRPISLRVPENILRLLKTKAAADGKKYQSLIIEILRESLKPRRSCPKTLPDDLE